jgi:hypothetical protein
LDEEAAMVKPLLKVVRKQSPPPPVIQKPPIKKPPMITEEIKKPEPTPPPPPPKKKKEPEPPEDDDDEYFDEEAEKEKDRLRRLRNMNRRAHRGFSQAEIMMMRWELVPKTMEVSEGNDDWECKICKRPIGFTTTNP